MWKIRCGECGHDGEAGTFFTSQKQRYACPVCGVAWRIERQGEFKLTESGFVIPPKNVCVVEPQMMLRGVH